MRIQKKAFRDCDLSYCLNKNLNFGFAPSLLTCFFLLSLLLPKVALALSLNQIKSFEFAVHTNIFFGEQSQKENLIPKNCKNIENSSIQLADFARGLVQVVSWVGKPEKLVQSMGPQLLAYTNPSPWPDIHERAKLARVPVVMYHDILPEKEVFFDVTPKELEEHLQLIQDNQLTPISFTQLITHLQTGLPLPDKPIVLTFDDGYSGHYQYVYPLLKKYGYPAVFSIYTSKLDKKTAGRSSMTWDQLKKMSADPLVTIAAHSISHPRDLRELSDEKLHEEVAESKRRLEKKLEIPIRYFTYPEGKYDERVAKSVHSAEYHAALTMNDLDERFAGESENLLGITRFGQSRLADVISQAWGGSKLPNWSGEFDFTADVELKKTTIDNTPLLLISGGKPITIHAKSRSQLTEMLAGTEAVAAVDGSFFSLKFLDSNELIGPVLSQSTNKFVPGNKSENPKLTGRPLVLISPHAVKYISFDPLKHNTRSGIEAEMPDVTDAFVAAGWLVKDTQPQPLSSFGNLYSVNEARHRAFWGINHAGQPTIGVSTEPIGSVELGVLLGKAGLQDAVMLDSGASTSLTYQGESLVGYVPRPVPHAVALLPPKSSAESACMVASR